jgi:threonine dehydratase
MLEQHADLDALVIPVGGGGLIAGVACAVKEIDPNIRIIGVQSLETGFDEKRRWKKHELVTLPANKTIADGIAVRCAGTLTFPMVQKIRGRNRDRG